ncbi:MAG: hypothetical protein L0211_12720 [Planctomycetaceae bacterium]|nr:hypothetical protein [Planctomycetaceae bacterium]
MALVAAGKAEMPHEVYTDERKVLLDLSKANTDQHDKAILTLATGSLGLTVTFISNIAPHPRPDTLVILFAGWGCLAASIGAMLLSFQTGQEACRRQLVLLDQEFQESERPDQTNWWSACTIWFNRGACFFFLAGVILILVFSGLNLLAAPPAPPVPAPASSLYGETSQMADSPQASMPPVQLPSQPPPSEPKPGTGHPAPSAPALPIKPATPPVKK